MKSPVNELQKALVHTLVNSVDVSNIIGNRVFDSVPQDAIHPYVSIGPVEIKTTDFDRIDIIEITIQLDAWSRSPGFTEVRELADAVRAALNNADLKLANNSAIYFVHSATHELRDPDGLTSHAAISFSAGVQRF